MTSIDLARPRPASRHLARARAISRHLARPHTISQVRRLDDRLVRTFITCSAQLDDSRSEVESVTHEAREAVANALLEKAEAAHRADALAKDTALNAIAEQAEAVCDAQPSLQP